MADTIDKLLEDIIAGRAPTEPSAAPASGTMEGFTPADPAPSKAPAPAAPAREEPYFPPGHPMHAPTPAPAGKDELNMDALLEQLAQGKTPRGELTPDEAAGMGPVFRAGNEVMGGAYRELANTLTLPVDAVLEAVNMMGVERFGKAGDARAFLKGALRKAGLTAPDQPVDSFFDKVGATAASNLITTAALARAAPQMVAAAATPNAGAVRQSVAQFGEEMINRPVTQVVGAIASAPGQVYGKEVGGSVGQPGSVTRAVGETVGEVLGGTASGVPLTGLSRRTGLIPKGEVADLRMQPVGEPIRNAAGEPNRMRTFSGEMLERELSAVDNRVRRIVDSLGSPTAVRGRVHERAVEQLRELERSAGRIEDLSWDAVRTRPMNQFPETTRALNEMLNSPELANQSPSVPLEFGNRLMGLITRPTSGVVGQPVTTIGELNIFRSEALRQMRENAGGTVKNASPDHVAQRFYNSFQQAILRDIDVNHPGDPEIARAREISRNFNERFRTGPVGEVLSLDSRGQNYIDPVEAMERLYRTYRGPEAASRTLDPLTADPITQTPLAQPPRGSRPLEQTLEEGIIQEYKNVIVEARRAAEIRAPIDQVAGKQTQAAAIAAQKELDKFANPNDPRVVQFARADQTIRGTARQLTEAWAERQRWLSSSLATVARQMPETVVGEVFTSPHPMRTARRIAAEMARDTVPGPTSPSAALDGFHVALVDHFLKAYGKSSVGMAEALKLPRIGGVLEDQLGPRRFAELKDIVKVAQLVEEGKTKGRTQKLGESGATFLAHMLGLSLGRPVAQLFGSGSAGSLSVPFKMAKLFREKVAGHFEMTDPAKMVALAVVDPDFMQKMRWQLPGSPREALALSRQQQAWARRLQTGVRTANEQLITPVIEDRERR